MDHAGLVIPYTVPSLPYPFLDRCRAYHEAGHAVLGLRAGFTIDHVTIEPHMRLVNGQEQQYDGWCNFQGAAIDPELSGNPQETLWEWVRNSLAGHESLSIHLSWTGEDYPPSGLAAYEQGDLPEAKEHLAQLGFTTEEAQKEQLLRAAREVGEALTMPEVWFGVDRLAEGLLRQGRVEGEEARRLYYGIGWRE